MFPYRRKDGIPGKICRAEEEGGGRERLTLVNRFDVHIYINDPDKVELIPSRPKNK